MPAHSCPAGQEADTASVSVIVKTMQGVTLEQWSVQERQAKRAKLRQESASAYITADGADSTLDNGKQVPLHSSSSSDSGSALSGPAAALRCMAALDKSSVTPSPSQLLGCHSVPDSCCHDRKDADHNHK